MSFLHSGRWWRLSGNDPAQAIPTRSERVSGGLWGLLIGDALGVPYEFAPAKRIPERRRIEMDPPVEFLRSHWGVKPGTWSDDGAQALCLLATLLERGEVDPHDLMDRIARWYRDGYFAVDRNVFDVGLQTTQSITAFLRGVPAISTGRPDEMGNGNGSLMRVMPLALWHTGSDEDLLAQARLQSKPTHAHARAELSCALVCLWARRLMANSVNAWMEAVEILEGLVPPGSADRHELDTAVRPRDDLPAKGSGYVVDTLHSVRLAMRERTFEDVVRAAVALGNDTDTTACVAGGVAGVKYGFQGIPRRWYKTLRGKELVEPLLADLQERMALAEAAAT